MHKIQKVLTIAVAGAILATSLSGCGGKKKSNPVAGKTETVIEADSDGQYAKWKDNTKVRTAIDSKDYATAISLATARIEDSPGDARAHFLLGQALLEKGDLIKARKSLEAAVKLSPDDLNFSRELSRCLATIADSAIEKNLPGEAIEVLKKLVKEGYKPEATAQKLAGVYDSASLKLIESGNYDEAETLLREGTNVLPDNPEIKVRLADLLISNDRLMEAERTLKALQETNPGHTPGLIAYARLLHRMGEVGRAGQIIEKILSNNPGDADALALKSAFNKDIPVVTVSRMPETNLNETSLSGTLEKLKLQEQSGNLSEQKKLLTTITNSFPSEEWALHKLSVVCEKLGQIDEAITSIEKYLQLKPDHAKSQLHYARCLYQKGDHVKALEIIDRLESTYPDKLEILSERGQVMARTGNFAQARVCWKQILDQNPDHAATLFNFGQLEMESGNHDVAATYFEKAIRKEPFNNKYRYFAGLNLVQGGQKEKADALWQASKSSLNSQDPYAARILKAIGEETPSTPGTASLASPPPPLNAAIPAGAPIPEITVVPGHVINESPLDPDYEKALEYARGGLYNEAIQSFKTVLINDPGNFNALMNLGKVFTATGHQAQAVAFYLKALKVDQRNVHALKALANSYSEIGMHNLAAQITDQMSVSNPDQLEGFPKYTQKAIKNDPRGIEPLAQALMAEGLHAEALAVVQNGLSQQSELTILHLLQGDVLKQMGQHEPALESYKNALSRDPQSPAPFIRIGDLYLASGQVTAAFDEYQKAMKSSFIDPDSMLIISDRLRQMGREADAKMVLGKIKGMNLNQEQLQKLDQRLGTSLAAPPKEETP
ncbi:MAG TPA: tetratricopeptide repeat protein [Candidatus Rifleibacterium sp.]|nr:tetratricopeptide repeat protein [Candidatus Rifleibacterium sp.]HPT44443.1 tetratricopeptide repeat protein [Candidatus Rifleibacterium sp.]